jgi:hypothetical protein
MSVTNLTRYSLCNINDDGPEVLAMDIQTDGDYVKFEEAMEASSNSLQQLKAEIRSAYAKWSCSAGRIEDARIFAKRVDELTAV